MTANAAKLLLFNQKNGIRGLLIHHHASSNIKNCLVWDLAQKVAHLNRHLASLEKLLCAYFDHLGKLHITSNNMLKLVHASAVALILAAKAFPAERMGTHLLQVGGTIDMKVNEESDQNIKKMDRWSTDTFLMYIHEQISHLTKVISNKVSQPFHFFNVDEGANKKSRGTLI